MDGIIVVDKPEGWTSHDVVNKLRRLADTRKGIYLVSDVVEKPTPTEAEQKLIVPGLRAGYYLCFFGMHVLTPRVLALLAEDVAAAGEKGRVQLSTALARLAA